MNFISGFWDSLCRFFSGGAGEDGLGGHRLYVGNLSYQVKEEELRNLFSKYGKVKALHLIRDRITRRLKGYAFLEMSPEDAPKALVLNGADFLGRKLVVSIAKAKKEGSRRDNNGGSNRQTPRGGNGPGRQARPGRWKKNRSGPRAYGAEGGENTPVQRYE